MTPDNSNSPFEHKLARQIDEQARALTAHQQQRLRTDREAALAQLDRAPTVHYGRWVAAAAGVIALAVVAFQMGPTPQRDLPFSTASTETLDDLELLTADEDLALFEDLEFFRWLSDVEDDLS